MASKLRLMPLRRRVFSCESSSCMLWLYFKCEHELMIIVAATDIATARQGLMGRRNLPGVSRVIFQDALHEFIGVYPVAGRDLAGSGKSGGIALTSQREQPVTGVVKLFRITVLLEHGFQKVV